MKQLSRSGSFVKRGHFAVVLAQVYFRYQTAYWRLLLANTVKLSLVPLNKCRPPGNDSVRLIFLLGAILSGNGFLCFKYGNTLFNCCDPVR